MRGNHGFFGLALASILATGCAGRAAFTPVEAPAPKAAPAEAAPAPAMTPAVAATPAPAASETKGARKVGDYVVQRFSGTFRKAPLTLTQRVVGREGSTLTVDVVADEAGAKVAMRITIDEASATKNDVVSAAWLENGVTRPATVEAYEKLLAMTTLVADENEALLKSEDVTVEVGGAAVPCRKTSYRVRVGKKHATMRTIESDGFPWGDVGGEIVGAHGKVLYKAEIVEMGGADKTPDKHEAVAHSDIDP